jgi:hypothetical protein
MPTGHSHNPLLVSRDEGDARPFDLLGCCRKLFIEPCGLRDEKEVLLPSNLFVIPLQLAQLLCQCLVLDVVEPEVGVGYQREPVGLQMQGMGGKWQGYSCV